MVVKYFFPIPDGYPEILLSDSSGTPTGIVRWLRGELGGGRFLPVFGGFADHLLRHLARHGAQFVKYLGVLHLFGAGLDFTFHALDEALELLVEIDSAGDLLGVAGHFPPRGGEQDGGVVVLALEGLVIGEPADAVLALAPDHRSVLLGPRDDGLGIQPLGSGHEVCEGVGVALVGVEVVGDGGTANQQDLHAVAHLDIRGGESLDVGIEFLDVGHDFSFQ